MTIKYLFTVVYQNDIEDDIDALQNIENFHILDIDGDIRVLKYEDDVNTITPEFIASNSSPIEGFIYKGTSFEKFYKHYLNPSDNCPCEYYHRRHLDNFNTPIYELETIHIKGCTAENCDHKKSYMYTYY